MNTRMTKDAKAKGVKGITMLSVHQLTNEEENQAGGMSDRSLKGQLEAISECRVSAKTIKRPTGKSSRSLQVSKLKVNSAAGESESRNLSPKFKG